LGEGDERCESANERCRRRRAVASADEVFVRRGLESGRPPVRARLGTPSARLAGNGEQRESEREPEAACRETREEASVEVELLRIAGVFGGYPDFHFVYPNGDEVAWIVTVFEARITSGEPAPGDDETADVRWATLAEASELGLSPATQHMLTRIGEGRSFN